MKIQISEKNLTAASVMPLFEAAQKIADMTGEMVTIEAYDGIKFEPAPKAKSGNEIWEEIMRGDHTQINMVEPHKWPDLNEFKPSQTPPGPNIDSGAAVKESSTTEWVTWHGGRMLLPGHVIVDCMLRNGEKRGPRTVDSLHWSNTGSGGDIVAYRTHNLEIPCTITTSSLLKDQVDVKN